VTRTPPLRRPKPEVLLTIFDIHDDRTADPVLHLKPFLLGHVARLLPRRDTGWRTEEAFSVNCPLEIAVTRVLRASVRQPRAKVPLTT